ncbi:hypothetical protein PJ985_04335 [Streptomyces sp. ACA25]|uniref:hypothetical protein n=1 Tax=Streptomyces sp. ACA25 TaxID=3022596 RepID=UPI0023077F99|nr:hypothetical protein [Streptomyces sp. ACA25]MDB1086792.1 hypothetical protein [Streptomyces sp. ACA25]
MGDFVSAALEFPAVVFTFPLLVVLGYWLFVALTGLSGDGVDTDPSDPPASSGSGHEGAAGHSGFLGFLGLGGVPVTLVFSLVVLTAWFVSLVGVVLFDDPLIRWAWFVLALFVAWHTTWLLARPLRRLLHTGAPQRNADFVGSICLVRTGRVDADFGQGEATAPDGSTALLQIRTDELGVLTSGSSALIYDYDVEGDFFRVTAAGVTADPFG